VGDIDVVLLGATESTVRYHSFRARDLTFTRYPGNGQYLLDFEQTVRDISMEADNTRFPPSLVPTDYFVQNVVDLQDLFGLRHCVFAIGLSGSNKSQTWQTLCKCWTRGAGNNPAGIGKTSWKDINPKSITPNELYGYINIATREWKDGMLSTTMRDMANAPDANPKWIILDGDLDANWIENMNSVMDDNRLLTLASNERIRLLVNMKMLFEIRDLAFASPATVTRAGVLYITDDNQWKNYVQAWINDWAENLALPKSAAGIRPEMKAAAEALFEKYVPPVLFQLAVEYKHIVANLLDFGLVQTITNYLQGLWTIENLGTKDTSSLEIYFVLASVWGFGGAMSVTAGIDYRKKFSQYWKDTFKAVKLPHRGEI
jgi:dynein heavy chain